MDSCHGVGWISAVEMDPCHGDGCLLWGWIPTMGMDPCCGDGFLLWGGVGWISAIEMDPCHGARMDPYCEEGSLLWGWIPAMGMDLYHGAGLDPCHGAGSLLWGWDGSLPWGWIPAVGRGCPPAPFPPGLPPGISSGLSPALWLCRCQSPALAHQIGPHPCPDPPRPLLGLQRAPTLAGTEGQPGPLPTPVGDELLPKHLAVHRNRSPPLITIIHHPALGRGCARFSRAGELLGLAGGFWGDTEASALVVASLLHCPPHTHPARGSASSWGLCKS